MTLNERVVVITGATGSLGRAAAHAFVEANAKVVVVGRDLARLAGIIENLDVAAEHVLTHAADMRDPAAANELVARVVDHFGRVDVLLHLVGGWIGGTEVVGTNSSDFETMLDQHVWTTWHMLQAFVPHFVAKGWGRIVIVSSPVVTRPTAKSGIYAAAKAAEEALVMTVAQETKASGVTANVIQVRAISEERKLPMASATPHEIVTAILYLCSEEAANTTSCRLPLTGGYF